MIKQLYSLSIWSYAKAVALAALWSEKARKRHLGSRRWQQDGEALKGAQPLWFHCASVGEFEQAKPLIHQLRVQYPAHKILVSFFSPSGYEALKDTKLADAVCYFPVDQPSQCKAWVNFFQPRLAVFVKYEYWFNMMESLSKNDVPMYLISAHFTEEQYLMKWPGSLLAPRLSQFNRIFVQDESSEQRLLDRGIKRVLVAGDTRVDQVLAIRDESIHHDWITQFCEGQKVVVMGSVWPADTHRILNALPEKLDFKIIAAPHNIGDECQQLWQQRFGDEMATWSAMDSHDPGSTQVLFVDAMGWLSKLYRFADVAYIGGGFGEAVHNTLEAAVYGIPVVFGPANRRFLEIQELKAIGAGTEVEHGADLWNALVGWMNDAEARREASKKLEDYFDRQRGASIQILAAFKAHLD